MTCDRVLEQLPLWVGGDLDPAAQAGIDAHLATCPACAAAAQAFRESAAWLREDADLPFSPEELQAFHLGVLAAVEKEATPRVRRFRPWPWLVAAAAAAGVLTFVPRPRHAPEAALPAMVPVLPEPPAPAVDPPPAPRPSARAVARPLEPREEITRIEFQTSDPNIRIIWLARAESQPPSPEL